MSWNHLKYDNCAYQKNLSESVSSLGYTLDPNKFYNCNACRNSFGLVGGNNVSTTTKNMVDLESDLMGVNRYNSDCPEQQYQPQCVTCLPTQGIACDHECPREKLNDLRECQMIQYGNKINHIGYSLKYPGCPIHNTNTINGQKMQYPPQMNPVRWYGNGHK